LYSQGPENTRITVQPLKEDSCDDYVGPLWSSQESVFREEGERGDVIITTSSYVYKYKHKVPFTVGRSERVRVT
jgi:hypothetical protein